MTIHNDTATAPHDHLTHARRSLFDAQRAVLDTIDPRNQLGEPCLTGSRHTRAVDLVEMIGAAITHCERLLVVVDCDRQAAGHAAEAVR